MKNRTKIISYLMAIAILLYGFKLALVNGGAAQGIPAAQMESQTSELITQNAILKEQILTVQSLTVISQKAKGMGFVPQGSMLVVRQK